MFSQFNPSISPRLIPVDKARVTIINKWILSLHLQTAKSLSLSTSFKNLVLPWASLGLLICTTGLTAIHCHSLLRKRKKKQDTNRKERVSAGKKTRWPYDGHFNELGTQISAKSMYRWLQSNEASIPF
jgi:hypothetical protein